jgi:CPA2 family monovalent cation:H+ antiporter-2
VLGATRFRARIEQFALPLRDVFGAFFFLSFGLALDPSTFGGVLWPVVGAVVMTLVINILGGQLIAWQNKFTAAQGFNAAAMLLNRGEFALILATLAIGAGLDPRLQPFAGLYVLTMAVIGPLLAVNSERIGSLFTRRRPRSAAEAQRDVDRDESIALVEAALASPDEAAAEDQSLEPSADPEFDPVAAMDAADDADAVIEQAGQQSDELGARPRDPEY